uniref:Gap junction protein n=1 Tax=Jaculus jaculus TaxID=51337 RepID=A0A8C5KRQ1_JACJA
MENLDLLGFLIVTLNCNMTIVGTLWLVVAVLLRMSVVILAGSPIYQDEQERFVCNTLQPGCANVCYDLFSPVSPLRFWLVQSLALLLPSAVFGAYALHRGARLASRGGRPRVPDLSAAYLAHLLARTGLEAALAALHYLLFGFSVPTSVSCSRAPCSGAVDCYVSRPTEKSLLMLCVWAVSALSFLLSAADLLCSVRRRTRASSVPASPPGLLKDPESCRHRGQAGQEGGRKEEGAWAARQEASSPAGKASVSGRLDLPDGDDSEAKSQASDKLDHIENGARSHRQATQDPGSKSSTRSGVPQLASQSPLAGHCASSQPPALGVLATCASAPHLRSKKSEWV